MSRAVFRSRADLDARGFDSGIRGMHKKVDGFKSKMGSIKGVIGKALAIGAVTKMSKSVLDMASNFEHMSSRANLGTDEFQAFNAVATDTGAKTEQVGTFLAKLRQQQFEAVKGNKGVRDSLAALGLEMSDVSKMTSGQFVEAVAKGYGQTRDFGALVKLTSTENAPKMEQALISLGEKGFGSLISQMEDAGRLMDTEFLDKLEDASTKMDVFKGKTTIFFANTLSKVAENWQAIAGLTAGISLDEQAANLAQKNSYERKKEEERQLEVLRSAGASPSSESTGGAGAGTETIRGNATNRFGNLRRVGGGVLGSGRTENLFKENVREVKKQTKLLEQVVDNTSEGSAGGGVF